MSRIEELIQELCPGGVEFLKIEDVCKKIISGGTPSTSRAEYYGGEIPWLRTQEVDWLDITDTIIKITEEGLKNSSANWIPANCVIVAMYGATAAKVAINKIPLTTNQACCNLEIDDEKANYKYVFYWLWNEYRNLKSLGEGSQSNINGQKVRNYPIPIPPLPIQQEIVSILDKFTQLGAELEAELEERKRQYEYYRDQLLQADEEGMMSSGVKAEWKTLGEVCTVQSGGTPTRSNPQYWNEGSIKWLGSTVCKNTKNVESITDFITEEGLKKSSAKLFKKETTLIALVGATIGKVAFLPFEATTNQNVAGLYPLEINKLNTSYLYYSCKALYEVFTNMSQDKLKMANLTFVRSLKIPIPPLSEQNRIVEILDKFDTLVNDTSIGIPAEIEARRKQYEYYRAKLLDFKECES